MLLSFLGCLGRSGPSMGPDEVGHLSLQVRGVAWAGRVLKAGARCLCSQTSMLVSPLGFRYPSPPAGSFCQLLGVLPTQPAPTHRGAPAKSDFLSDPRPVQTASDARRSLWHIFRPLFRMLGARVRGPYCPWSSRDTWEETVHHEVESDSDSEIPRLQSCSSGPLPLTG